MRMRSVFISTLWVALSCAGISFFTGCGTSEQQADHAAQKAVEATDADRAKAQSLDDLDRIQKSYDTLASDRNLSKQMQVLVRGRQAQLRLERIMMMTADLRSQELSISRTIEDIERLAMRIAGAQSSVDALQSYDPTAGLAAMKAQEDEIRGSASQLTRTMANPTASDPNGKTTSPTLFAVAHEIETLAGKIQANLAASEAAKKLGAAKSDGAEVYLRKAEGETGDQQVSDTTNAAQDRRDASIADSHVDTLKIEMAGLEANLGRAKDQQTALESAIKMLDGQMEALQSRWTSISEQLTTQKNDQKEIIGGETSGTNVTIAQRATELAAALQDAAKLREGINSELNAVIPQLDGVIQQCVQLHGAWIAEVREKQDDPDVIIWKQAAETLHPMYFNMEKASALETRASIAGAKTRIDRQIARMFDGFEVDPADVTVQFKSLDVAPGTKKIKIPGITELLASSRTGVEMPKVFGDIIKSDPDQLKQSEDDTNKAFDEAAQSYDAPFAATDSGPAADERRNIALMGQASVCREWAKFASAIGDKDGAANHERAAEDAEGQIDPTFRLATTAAATGNNNTGGNSNTGAAAGNMPRGGVGAPAQ